jgi:hypothetical protein
VDLVPAQLLAAVGQRELVVASAFALDLKGLQRVAGRAIKDGAQRLFGAVDVHHDQAVVECVQPGGRDRVPRIGGRQSGLDEASEVLDISGAP